MLCKTRSSHALAVVALATTALLSSCKKDPVEVNPTGTTSTASTSYINNWILTNMRDAYYWNDKIPASPNLTLAPADFFASLLNTYNATTNPQGDRFSWIQESAAELTASLNGESKTTGMDFTLILTAQGSTDVVGVVTYVLPGSPADLAGIKRNDLFYSVNGVVLTTDQATLNKAFADESVPQTYGFAAIQNGAVTRTTTTKTVTPIVFQENPILKDSVYTVGNRKIGYLLYNQFVPGPNGSSIATYDNQFKAVFGKFKTQGVNELILDLRYNGGGYVSSSIELASLIAKGINGQSNALYYRQEVNPTLTAQLKKEGNGLESLNQYFTPQANNIGSQLNRVYVITTRRTASASELIINGLRPYMTVNTIGSTSYGKNVGSITISDKTNTENKWGMQPIIFRSFNKNNESDYWTGFTPTVAVNEPYGALVPLGDLRDPLLATAINHMNGLTGGRQAASPDLTVGSSDDFKPGANNMFITKPIR
ncbi:S41 family peptidase [Fibrella sp. WM1]|uniref:S41 family peptidase n=1 Tax=Fibrella musci TaxID=3242485 RepID=UPI0035225E77